MTDQSLEQLIEERNKALISMDRDYVRKRMSTTDEKIIDAILHKARYETTTIPDELRHESYRWLKENGFSRMTGEPLLPEGVLPR